MARTIDGESLRAVMRRVPSPVTVVTVAEDDEIRGITIGSFTSVSLKPPLISFNVAKDAQMHDLVTSTRHFAVHLLSDQQAYLSNHFAVPDRDGTEQFATVPHERDENGIPVLEDVLAVFKCQLYAVYPAGDHSLVVGEVTEIREVRAGHPILYFDRAYRSVGEEVKLSLFSPVKRASNESS